MDSYTLYEGSYTGIKYKADTIFDYCVSIPNINEHTEFGLVIEHDYRNKPEEDALFKLASEGKAPYCVFISVAPGYLPLPNNTIKNMRLDDYDLLQMNTPTY